MCKMFVREESLVLPPLKPAMHCILHQFVNWKNINVSQIIKGLLDSHPPQLSAIPRH